MLAYTMYVCENCGYECADSQKMEDHEKNCRKTAHLTKEQIEEWEMLKNFLRHMESVIDGKKKMKANNEKKEELYKKAVLNLDKFERIHHIK